MTSSRPAHGCPPPIYISLAIYIHKKTEQYEKVKDKGGFQDREEFRNVVRSGFKVSTTLRDYSNNAVQ